MYDHFRNFEDFKENYHIFSCYFHIYYLYNVAPLIRGRIEAAFGKEAKTVRESVLPGGKMYNLEILAVLDYGIYERYRSLELRNVAQFVKFTREHN